MNSARKVNKVDKKEKRKVKESQYLIVVPIVITIICAWLDIWTNYASGAYQTSKIDFANEKYIGTFVIQDGADDVFTVYQHTPITQGVMNFTSIVRCVMGYLVPSILSIMVVMVWQQTVLKVKPYGLQKQKVAATMFATVLYAVSFVTCLIKYNIYTSILAIIASGVYVVYIYTNCIDNRIKPKLKSEMTEDELLLDYLNKEKK